MDAQIEKVEQDVERWVRELFAAGWRRYRYHGHDYIHIWVSPQGTLYRGPYGAWKIMRSLADGPQKGETK